MTTKPDDFANLIPERIVVSTEAFDELQRMLDAPMEPTPRLAALLAPNTRRILHGVEVPITTTDLF